MELKIISNNENALLNRKEIRFEAVQEGSTVRKDELKKELCKRLNLHPDSTIIVRIDQGYGVKECSGIAHAYQSKEMLEKYESKRLVARIAKKTGKSEQKDAEPKADAPEEKKGE